MGRPITYVEYTQMRYCHNLVRLYEARSKADNLVEWVNQNLTGSEMLKDAQRTIGVNNG